jgi:menaquinone reductase, molybdopterin-binding-like subunit
MDRRDFIKLTAITGTSATLASCGSPENQIIRFVPEDDIVPGIAEWKPSVCPLCGAGCGVTVRVMDADVDTVRNGQHGIVAMTVAKKLEGDPKHPISRGGLCARGQAAIQITYHPDRLRQPMKRTGSRGTGEFTPISWDEAVAELVGKLDALGAAGDAKSLAVLARPRRGQRLELLTAFAHGIGAAAPLTFELFDDRVLRRANALSFGRDQLPTFDFGRSRYVIAFGADFLGTWNSPVSQSAAYGEMRRGHAQTRGKLVQVEPRMSLTGASADEWMPARPGTEGVVALGLAHVIVNDKLRPDTGGRAAALVDGWSGGLSGYTPARVEQMTGVPAKKLERLARELAEFPPAVAVVGGPPLAHTNGLFTALAVNALNALLGSVEQPGGVFFTPGVHGQQSAITNQQLVERLSAAKVLLLDEANPVYGMPSALGVREALAKIQYIASFGSFVDDTSAYADLILPDHSFLESWVQSAPESGSLEAVKTVADPVMKPIHETRATADVLIDVAGKLKTPISLPWKNAEEVAKGAPSLSNQQSPVTKVRAVGYAEPRFDGDAATYPFHFLPYPSVAFGDGSAAHLPWLQELPDPLTSAMWSSWVEINPQTAAKLGIAQSDVVEIKSGHGVVRAPAVIFPGIAPDVVAMPVGQGHEHFTQYASGRGANPVTLLAPSTEPETGALAWSATRVALARVGPGDGSLTLFAGEMREQPHRDER